MSGFWNWWILGLTVANVAFAVILLYRTSGRRPGDQAPGAETTGHVWDGDLAEYNNPLPRWWLWLFYLTIAFAIAYLALFPGIVGGTLGWTAKGQWQAETASADATMQKAFARFDGVPIETLATDPAAVGIGRNLFAANCTACHGADARGAHGFPNLTSPNLTWGASPDDIVATISNGRQGVMPPWKDALGSDGVEAVANYVYTLSGRTAPSPALVAAGQEKFATFCAACHGPDGKGSTLVGAPNLTDEYWIWGGSIAAIRETIANGRSNRMPAHLDVLGERKIRLLAAYVTSLKSGAASPAAAHEPGP
jgi:cytochrome c oxidase cbb3-type subunit 3